MKFFFIVIFTLKILETEFVTVKSTLFSESFTFFHELYQQPYIKDERTFQKPCYMLVLLKQ